MEEERKKMKGRREIGTRQARRERDEEWVGEISEVGTRLHSLRPHSLCLPFPILLHYFILLHRPLLQRWIWSVWREIWEGSFEWRKWIWFLRSKIWWSLCCICCASLFSDRARERKRERASERERNVWRLRKWRKIKRLRAFFSFFNVMGRAGLNLGILFLC